MLKASFVSTTHKESRKAKFEMATQFKGILGVKLKKS